MDQPVTDISTTNTDVTMPFTTKIFRLFIRWIFIISGLWIFAIIYLWFRQESFLFHPEQPGSDYTFNLQYTSEVYIDVEGAKLHALYLRQPAEQSRGIVLFLHGNAGNLKTWFTHADFWLSTGYDVLMPDYRGFGKSTGHIESESQLNDDVLRAWNFVAPNYKNKKHVIYGRSLGTGLATKLATEVPTDLVVLVSPYESMTKIAKKYYPWVPSFVLRYPLPTEEMLPGVRSKILLIHGTDDQLIPVAHSRNLQKLNPNAHLVEIPGAGHGDIHDFDLYIATLKNALNSLP